jgi:altronate dehydratase
VKKVEVSKLEVKTGWSAIAAKPKEVQSFDAPVRNSGFLVLSDYIKNAPAEKLVIDVNVAPWVSKPIITKSWVDWSEGEDE